MAVGTARAGREAALRTSRLFAPAAHLRAVAEQLVFMPLNPVGESTILSSQVSADRGKLQVSRAARHLFEFRGSGAVKQ
jgi:hypothetical protein